MLIFLGYFCNILTFFCGFSHRYSFNLQAGELPLKFMAPLRANKILFVMTPQELQELLDELKASRSSRKPAWENLQELRWVLQDSARMKLPQPAKKTIDLKGKLIEDGVRKAIRDRQNALHELLNAINQYRKLSESKSLTLQGSDYAHSVLELNKAIDHAEGLL
jgi:hypothetical protein